MPCPLCLQRDGVLLVTVRRQGGTTTKRWWHGCLKPIGHEWETESEER